MSGGRPRVSPSALATFAACPRQYEYDRVWDVTAPDRSERYLNRGLVYHGVLEDVCERFGGVEDCSDDAIRSAARSALDERWERHVDPGEYYSDAQRADDRALVERAIESYLDDEGVRHVRDSVAAEVWLRCERDGVALVGRADNVVRTDEGLRVIDYKGSLKRVVSRYSASDVAEHASGEAYAPDRLKSAFQAATYIEGAKRLDAYEPGSEVAFTFYGLTADTDHTPSIDGVEVSASGRSRDVTGIYEDHEDEIWALATEYYERIVTGDYAVDRWPEIREHACGDCDYRTMCADYLGAEVRARE